MIISSAILQGRHCQNVLLTHLSLSSYSYQRPHFVQKYFKPASILGGIVQNILASSHCSSTYWPINTKGELALSPATCLVRKTITFEQGELNALYYYRYRRCHCWACSSIKTTLYHRRRCHPSSIHRHHHTVTTELVPSQSPSLLTIVTIISTTA